MKLVKGNSYEYTISRDVIKAGLPCLEDLSDYTLNIVVVDKDKQEPTTIAREVTDLSTDKQHFLVMLTSTETNTLEEGLEYLVVSRLAQASTGFVIDYEEVIEIHPSYFD